MNVALNPAFIAGQIVDYATFTGKKSPVESVKCTGRSGNLEEIPEDEEVSGPTLCAVRTESGLELVTKEDVILLGDEGAVVVLTKAAAELMYEPL